MMVRLNAEGIPGVQEPVEERVKSLLAAPWVSTFTVLAALQVAPDRVYRSVCVAGVAVATGYVPKSTSCDDFDNWLEAVK